MPNKSNDRARIFMPFDGLKGFKEAIKEKEKNKIVKKQLTEDSKEELSYKINQIKSSMIIKIVYFDNENYIEIEGMVSKISIDERYIKIVKTKIDFDSIISISGNDIKEYF